MDNVKVAKYRMYFVFSLFLTFYKTLFGGFKKLGKAIDTFRAVWKVLIDLVPDESAIDRNTKPITISKNQLFDNLTNSIWAMTKLALIWANEKKDPDLIALFSIKYTDLTVSEPTFIALAKAISKALTANAAALIADDSGIEDVQISDLAKEIPIAEALIGKPAAMLVQSSITTTNVDKAFSDVDAKIEIIKDLILGKYGPGTPNANPEVIKAMKKSVKLNIDKKYTGIKFMLIDAITGLPIKDVLVDIPDLNKKVTSDVEGVAPIKSMQTKKALATFSHPNYDPLSQLIQAEKGKTIEITIKLTPKK